MHYIKNELKGQIYNGFFLKNIYIIKKNFKTPCLYFYNQSYFFLILPLSTYPYPEDRMRCRTNS